MKRDILGRIGLIGFVDCFQCLSAGRDKGVIYQACSSLARGVFGRNGDRYFPFRDWFSHCPFSHL